MHIYKYSISLYQQQNKVNKIFNQSMNIIERKKRNERLLKSFKVLMEQGHNKSSAVVELSRMYNLTGVMVYKILKEYDC